MADVIKTQYMDKAVRGYSEYIARDLDALQTISPKEGDRAILLDGSLYICVDNGTWDIAGGAKETDVFIITVTGHELDNSCTIDKTYAEIYLAYLSDKTIIMIDSIFPTVTGLPLILSPYFLDSDGNETFVTIAGYEDMGESKDYRHSIIVHPDGTATVSREELSQELDYTVTFTVDGEPYEIVSVKDGNSVNAPATEPIKEGYLPMWLVDNAVVSFPYTPISNVEMVATFFVQNLTVTTPIYSTFHSEPYSPKKAFDKNYNTRWATSPYQTNNYIGADFGKPTYISKVVVIQSEYVISDIQLQCSDDNISWLNASDRLKPPIFVNNKTEITPNERNAHRYWRIFSPTDQTLSELEFYGYIEE